MIASPSIQAPMIAVLGVIPIIILIVFGLVSLIDDREIMMRLLAFASLTGLGIAFIGATAFPALDLPRYLGLGLVVLLTILSPQSLEILLSRGRVSASYVFSLILLTITSFGFTGTLMPENSYTANLYAIGSISGSITYSEAYELRNIASMLCYNNFLIDWRAGHYFVFLYLWVYPEYRGYHNIDVQSSFIFAGSYDLLITPGYPKNFNGLWIFRNDALQMPEAYLSEVSTYMTKLHINASVIYFSSAIQILDLSRNAK